MRYLFVFVSILIVWIAMLAMAGLLGNTHDRFELYLITMVFTVAMYLLGFLRKA